jgi:hypothetical protein
MKGIQGLIVAVVLGVVGAAANFYYLNTEALKQEMVPFIGIKKGVIIGRGDRLSESNLVKVEIPKPLVGNLKDYACQWEEFDYVKTKQVWRTLDSSNTEGGLLLLRSDYREPPKELELAKGERAEGIIAPRSFVTSLVNPGDKVSFRVTTMAPIPTPAARVPAAPANSAGSVTAGTTELQPKPEEAESSVPAAGLSQVIGPFTVVSVGNRLGTVEVMKTARIAPTKEDVLMLRVSKNVPREEENFEKLLNCIRLAGANGYSIILNAKE